MTLAETILRDPAMLPVAAVVAAAEAWRGTFDLIHPTVAQDRLMRAVDAMRAARPAEGLTEHVRQVNAVLAEMDAYELRVSGSTPADALHNLVVALRERQEDGR